MTQTKPLTTTAPAPADLDAMRARSAADYPEHAAAILAGEVLVMASIQAPGNGRVRTVCVFGVIRTADGKLFEVDGEKIHMIKLQAKRNFTPEKMAAWWGGKIYGAGLPVDLTRNI